MGGLAQNLSFILLGEDRSATKTMTKTQETAEKVTGAIGGSFSKLGGVIGGEFGNILDDIGSKVEDLGSKGVSLGGALQGAGGIAAAAGVGLMALGSGEKQASAQLSTAIKATGKDYEDYSKQIEKVIAKNQDFDFSALDTKKALTILTESTGSTKTALNNMQVVTDLAAAKHISLASAAGQVAKVLNGSGGKALAAYGITMEKAYDPTEKLAAAQNEVTKAGDTLAAAQLRLSQLQEIDHGKKKLSISDHIALQNAQNAVTKATTGVSAAQDKLNGISTVAITKQQAGKEALDQLSKKLDGQAKSAVQNFGSQVDVAKTKVVDWVEEMAGPAGEALTVIGTVTGIAGTAIQIYQSHVANAALATVELEAAQAAASVATDVETASMTALDVAMDANPIGMVVGALGLLAGVIGTGVLLSQTQKQTRATTDYTGALRDDTDAIGEHTRAQATQALVNDGALQAAQKLGISAKLVVDATLGQAGAQKELNKEIAAAQAPIDNSTQATANGALAYNGLSDAQREAAKNIKVLTDTVGGQSLALQDDIANNKLYEEGLGETSATARALNKELATMALNLTKVSNAQQIALDSARITSGAPGKEARRATGGYVGSNEYTLVGEQGPEWAKLPAGTRVLPHGSQSPMQTAQGGLTIGAIYMQPNQSVSEMLQAAGWYARMFTK